MVEGNGLENRRAGNGSESSNLSLSARENTQSYGCVFSIARSTPLWSTPSFFDTIIRAEGCTSVQRNARSQSVPKWRLRERKSKDGQTIPRYAYQHRLSRYGTLIHMSEYPSGYCVNANQMDGYRPRALQNRILSYKVSPNTYGGVPKWLKGMVC